MYVYPCTYTAWGTHHHTVYPHVRTPVYIPIRMCRYLYYLPMHMGWCAHGYYEGAPMRWARCGFGLRLRRVAFPHRSPPLPTAPRLDVYESVWARERL